MPFMDNLSKIGKSVGKSASSVAKKSGELVGISKLNMNIAAEQDDIKVLNEEIGQVVYEKYKSGERFEEEITEKCVKISELELKIHQVKKKILEIKDIKVCPKCGTEMTLKVAFCSKCGEKQEIPIIEENDETSCDECSNEISNYEEKE